MRSVLVIHTYIHKSHTHPSPTTNSIQWKDLETVTNLDCSTKISLFSKRNQGSLWKWLIPCLQKKMRKAYGTFFIPGGKKSYQKATRVIAKEANFKILPLAKTI